MICIEEIFKNKKLNIDKLVSYGFTDDEDDIYVYKTDIENDFQLIVKIKEDGIPDYFLMEKNTGDEYILVKTSAAGGFVGNLREACLCILEDIRDKCYEDDVYKWEQSKMTISYINDILKTDADYPWKKASPENAVFKHFNTGKWFALIMKVDASKIHADERTGIQEILCLKARPKRVKELIATGKALPAYHMSKEHWMTIILDGQMMEDVEIMQALNESFFLTILSTANQKKYM